jgi:hypothetical protein
VGGGAGGQAAKDALGNTVKLNEWLSTHKAGDRQLTQGLKVRAASCRVAGWGGGAGGADDLGWWGARAPRIAPWITPHARATRTAACRATPPT